MKNIGHSFVHVFLPSILLGAASGVFATAWTTNYLADYSLELSTLTQPLQRDEEKPRAFPASHAEAVRQLKDQALPSVARLLPISARSIQSPDPNAFTVTILTSDGWMFTKDLEAASGSRVLTASGVCNVEKTIRDPLGFQFIKCQETSLSVTRFGEGYGVEPGEQVFIAWSDKAFAAFDVVDISFNDSWPVSSETPHRRLKLAGGYQPPPGSPVFDLASSLVGYVDAMDENGVLLVMPIENILPSFTSLLETGEIVRPALGVSFVDLSRAVVVEELSRGYTRGALLYGPQAVLRNSPAEQAGLREGDIILEAGRESIGNPYSLDELLVSRQPGDVVTFTIDRAGQEMTLIVTLGKNEN